MGLCRLAWGHICLRLLGLLQRVLRVLPLLLVYQLPQVLPLQVLLLLACRLPLLPALQVQLPVLARLRHHKQPGTC